jgi:hypothetical protein
LAQPIDPRSLTCDSAGIKWERTGFADPALWSAPRDLRRTATFVNRGQKAWPLVNRNQATAIGAYWASACPMDGTGSTPLRQGFAVSVKNGYGSPVIYIEARFQLQTGGGAGKADRYITRLEIAPAQVELARGWTVDLAVTLREPEEYGEASGPCAAMQAVFDLSIETEIKKMQQTSLFVIFPQGVVSV